jgi:hypothetical protein
MDEAGTETTGTERTGAERAGTERARTKEQGQKEQEQKSRDRESGNRRNKNGNSTIGSSRKVNSTEVKSRRSARSKCSLGQDDEQKEDALMDTHGIIRVGRAHAVRSIRLIRSRNEGVGMSVASSKEECIESRTRRWNIMKLWQITVCYVMYFHIFTSQCLLDCLRVFPQQLKHRARSTVHLGLTPSILAQVVQ